MVNFLLWVKYLPFQQSLRWEGAGNVYNVLVLKVCSLTLSSERHFLVSDEYLNSVIIPWTSSPSVFHLLLFGLLQ